MAKECRQVEYGQQKYRHIQRVCVVRGVDKNDFRVTSEIIPFLSIIARKTRIQ